jgi:hypothetical protein
MQDSVHFIVEDVNTIIEYFKKASSKLSKKCRDASKSQEITMLVYPHLVSLYARTQANPVWIYEAPSKYKGIRFVYKSSISPFQKPEDSHAMIYLVGGSKIIFESDI